MAEPLTCTEAQALIAVASLDALDRDSAPDLARHLAGCNECRQVARDDRALVELLPTALEQRTPPARLRRQLMSQVYAESQPSAAAHRPSIWERLRLLVPESRALTGGAVAVALVACLASAWFGTHRPSVATPTLETTAYAISGTTVDPQASGTVTADRSDGHAVVTVHGLPSTNSDDVYELWLIPAHGNPVAAGFLSPSPSGSTWTGVVLTNVSRYRSLAATVEPNGGSPGPTGEPVITSTIGG